MENPAISKVFDTERGEDVQTDELLGDDEAKIIQLRLAIMNSNQEDRARFLCPECFVPLSLICRKEARRYFFRHLIEDGRCSALTRGELSQADINRRKYNGAKESFLHREMKQWIVDSLQASGQFKSITQEKRWAGPITGAWRKPDVSAIYGNLRIAFEVQLSTTFLNVIAERWRFYLNEGGLLFWIFARFDDDGRRLTQDDVFFNNNHNAFIVSKATRDASIAAGQFLLDCAWATPSVAGVTPQLSRARVAFTDLTLDAAVQQAYYFDYAVNMQLLLLTMNASGALGLSNLRIGGLNSQIDININMILKTLSENFHTTHLVIGQIGECSTILRFTPMTEIFDYQLRFSTPFILRNTDAR